MITKEGIDKVAKYCHNITSLDLANIPSFIFDWGSQVNETIQYLNSSSFQKLGLLTFLELL